MPRGGLLDLPDSTPELNTHRLRLRPPASSDADVLLAIYNQPDVLAALNRDQPASPETISKWLSKLPRGAALGLHYAFAIEVIEGGAVIGLVELASVHARLSTAEPTIWIDPVYRRRGYASEALRRVLAWAMEDLRLARLDGAAVPSNVASIELMPTVGMRDEGDQTIQTKTDSRPVDARVFTYTKESHRSTS